ncbi:MAG: hypothetical protein P4L46_00680 [Fimbriimonas sp.]|nr:hypothetical protein [Fimbriimonas sp.]
MSDRKFLAILIACAVLLAGLPFLIGLATTPPGGSYIGFQFGTDDHMVYAAWMRQAANGHFLMDNRFTTDAQPGITIHLYFFVLGLISKVTGIALASTLARLCFSGLFVVLLFDLIRRIGWSSSTTRLATVFSVIGGGVGFLVWHMFGLAIVRPAPPVLGDLLGGLLPIDVWQPEAFVFPSMLTNGLFMVSLCLILVSIRCLIESKDTWKPVLPGALALGVLMNIHSYDVLLIALIMIGFLVCAIVSRQVTKEWLIRAGCIVAGVLPAALWFVHVLKSDAVFQARAQTDTPTADFRAVLFGYILLMVPALVGLYLRPIDPGPERTKRQIGTALAALLIMGMYMASTGSHPKYFLDAGAWVFVLLVALAATALLADESPVMNLFIAWALVGTVAIYFPGLFQRKLSMGLSIPWAVLAAYGVESILKTREQSIRTLGTAFAAILLGATSIRWLAREIQFIKSNASNTSVQTVYLEPDAAKIMDYLNGLSGRHVLLAPPGIPSQAFSAKTQENGTDSITPVMADLNPIASGLTGVYTYAGHWSETPDYLKRRSELTRLYYGKIEEPARQAILKKTGADYMIAIGDKVLPIPLFDFSGYGDVVVRGSRFSLIHLKPG